ncbi:MAG: hypothetical protein AAGB13_17825 [Cyanobacteria bacterium P01_F01_bin.33]
MSKSRMGGKLKLSEFGQALPATSNVQPSKTDTPKTQAESPEKLATVNIKIRRSQHQWLNEVARAIRDRNDAPVPPNQRVYPQHLIGVAIDLLVNTNIDWEEIYNTDDLADRLNL